MGVAAYWDFLNNPDQDEPRLVDDSSWFPGTQFQILLPQHKHDRPRTYVALHLVGGLRKQAVAKPIAIPQTPTGTQDQDFVRHAVRNLRAVEGIWHELDARLRNRIDYWTEEQVRRIGPKHVVSYTQFGNALLARALVSKQEAKLLHLGNYLDLHSPDGLKKLKDVGKGDLVVILLDISGSGKTVERLLDSIERRGAMAHVVSLIDTISEADRKRRPRLDGLYRNRRVEALVSHPIDKVPAIPKHGPTSAWPVVKIDPVTLLPIPEVLDDDKVMSDGEFWGFIARTGTLSTTSITYKGQEFGSFIWLTGLFNDAACAKRIVEHLGQCIRGGKPERVLITQEATEFLPKNSALLLQLLVEYPQGLWLEGRSGLLDEDELQNKKVAIFSTASTTGSGIARLLKKCSLASRVHLCTFINRMSNDIASTFVQKSGVTFSAFQRLYSGSPSQHHGSYRTAALRSLDGYQRACISNRLSLYVDEQRTTHRQEHAFVESALELQHNPKILAAAFEAGCFRNGDAYELTTTAGLTAIKNLIQNWSSDYDLTVLEAVLEEACCRRDSADDAAGRSAYLKIVEEMYTSARTSRMPDRMRELVLSVMFLQRLPGERYEESALAQALAATLWGDFLDSVKRGDFGVATVCLRSCAKLDPQRILANLGDAVANCARCRVTELSLALELSKMRDDEKFAEAVLEALRSAKPERFS